VGCIYLLLGTTRPEASVVPSASESGLEYHVCESLVAVAAVVRGLCRRTPRPCLYRSAIHAYLGKTEPENATGRENVSPSVDHSNVECDSVIDDLQLEGGLID
jgi:hypothetical protein